MNPSSEDITSPEDRNFASDNASVHAWYKELHPKVKKARESVARLIRESSLTQVEKYINDLAQAFARLPPNTSPESRDFGWNLALSCDVDVLQTGWETDDELTEEFIRLVFFHRYPKWAAAKIEPATKLKALKATSHEAAENLLELASSGVPDPQHVKILKDGYNHPYLRNDQIVKPILERLSENAKNWKPNEYLAPYTALIGPSMCGKTRLLMKLSEYVCVIYICLRERGSSGQPPRSVLADEMELDNKNVPKLLEHYYRLLAAIFDVVADFFLSRTAGRDEKQLLLEWSNYNHESGDRLATEVRQRMEEISLQESAALTIFTDKLKKLASSTSFISNPKLKILLGFDEARALIKQGTKDDQNLPYFRILRRVLSQVPSTPNLEFCALFTDTTSKVANFVPALHNDPSARPPPDSNQESKKLYPPIYAIGTFDSKVSSSPPTTWDELLSPRRLFSYGTPFFRIYVETAEQPPESLPINVIAENVRKMAIEKLLCSSRELERLSEGQIFALLGCTIQPQIYEAAKLNSELVSSHMAQCLYISPTRERLISEYPSQYTLSVAANHFLAGDDDSKLISCIKALTSFMQQGLISSGNSGELVSRIILLLAMQKAMSTSPIPTTQPNITYGCSVRLVDFLKALTGKEDPTGEKRTAENSQQASKPTKRSERIAARKSTTKIDRAGKDESTGTDESIFQLDMDDAYQARLLKEGRIFWNHSIQITYTPEPADFLNFLYRGMAVQCKPNQKGFDQMFTVYLSPEDTESTITKDRISFCGVQAKNGAFKWPEEGPKWNSEFADVKLDPKIPYLIIVFSFRTGKTEYKLPKIPQRGSLIFHGLEQFGCLTPKVSTALEELLSVDPDVRQFHEGNKHTTSFIETTRPCVYKPDTLDKADEGIVIDRAPDDQTL
ncbi:hypothetical protein PTTG_26803 [Puccinia triticina 1-1 BBBD Race 1]|uniref:Uncharacterized protein n=1 Tax=Puccinia triticina (isolate 1-1 / race 1 (BBBD)) TaxID=630390 RepID=A0A180GS24_PUCT1|nr:hypothetical protein PTTG_26803 [Puccinia triticina 1-1 BBBD Race 1]